MSRIDANRSKRQMMREVFLRQGMPKTQAYRAALEVLPVRYFDIPTTQKEN